MLRSGKEDAFYFDRLQAIDCQLPLLTQRHRLIQKAALLAHSAIAVFISTMFAIALSVALNAGVVGMFALGLFLVGTGILLLGIFFASLEIRISHQALCYEVHQIISFNKGKS